MLKPSFCRTKFTGMLFAGLFSYVVSMVITACDKIIAGFFFGTEGLSALAVTDPLYSVVAFLGLIIVSGVRCLYPIEIGKKNVERANKLFSCALTSAIVVSIGVIIVLIVAGDYYFTFQNLTGTYLDRSREYFVFSKYVFAFLPVIQLINAIIFTNGGTKTISLANTVYVISNIVLSVVFAYMFGMVGIGLGTLAGGLICLFIECSYFFKEENTVSYRPWFSLKDLLGMARYGIAEASFSIVSGLNGIIINWFIIQYLSESFLAVNSVVGYALYFSLFFGGCQTSMVALLNIYLGEGNRDGMIKVLKLTAVATVIMGVALTVATEIIAPLIPRLFSITSPELVELCTIGVRISVLSYTVTGLLGIVTRYYNAIGKAALATTLSVVRDSIIYVSQFVILGYMFGDTGIWFCNVLSPIISALVFAIIIFAVCGRKNPFCMPGMAKKIKSWDINVDQESIITVRNEAEAYLKEQGKSHLEINRMMYLIEEYCMMVLDNNTQTVVMEITIIDDGKKTRAAFRDTGAIADVADEEHDTTAFRSFAFSGFSQIFDSKDYVKMTGCNYKEFALSNESENAGDSAADAPAVDTPTADCPAVDAACAMPTGAKTAE